MFYRYTAHISITSHCHLTLQYNMEAVVAVKQPKGKGKTGVKRTATAKAKIIKPKANPFRRSDTGKLQLKRLQMTKRVEVQTPKITLMRERLELAESRIGSVSKKLKLVNEELASRKEKAEEKAAEDKTVEDPDSSELSEDEEIELDSEVEDEAVTGN